MNQVVDMPRARYKIDSRISIIYERSYGEEQLKSLVSDTEPWAAEMQIELLRNASPARRFELACQLSAMIWNGARAAIDRLHPEETQDQRDLRFLSELYGLDLAKKFIAYRQSFQGIRSGKV